MRFDHVDFIALNHFDSRLNELHWIVSWNELEDFAKIRLRHALTKLCMLNIDPITSKIFLNLYEHSLSRLLLHIHNTLYDDTAFPAQQI